MSLDLNPTTKRGPVVFIGAVALLSLGLAYGFFWLVSSGVFSFGTTNHGKFVEPRTLAYAFGLVDQAGETFDSQGKWSLWLVTQENCAAHCQDRLTQMRTLHVLLHRDAPRVQRVLASPHMQSLPDALNKMNPELKQLSGAAIRQLGLGIYIVDPLTQLVLHYEPEAEIEWILEDLKRLLKVSQIG